jgi:hypothetical protein
MLFLRLLIIDFVNDVHANHLMMRLMVVFLFCIFLHILDKMNIIAYFDYMNAKNECFIVYFVINIYNLILVFCI